MPPAYRQKNEQKVDEADAIGGSFGGMNAPAHWSGDGPTRSLRLRDSGRYVSEAAPSTHLAPDALVWHHVIGFV